MAAAAPAADAVYLAECAALTPLFTWTAGAGTDVLCLAFTADGAHLASGASDGIIRVFRADRPKPDPISVLVPKDGSKLPVTALRYVPGSGQPPTLIATYATGVVRHWHPSSGTCLKEFTEKPVFQKGVAVPSVLPILSLTSLDVACDGKRYVTGGTNPELSVYDTATQQRVHHLGITPDRAGQTRAVATMHSNRVFAIKCHPTDPNLLYSAGWDSTVQFWDLRSERPITHVSGPFVCGDALDVDPAGNRLLAGSYRELNSLQVFDLKTGNLARTLSHTYDPSWLYGCLFVAGRPDRIACCGTKRSTVRVVDAATGNAVSRFEAPATLYALAQPTAGGLLAAGGVGGKIYLFGSEQILTL